MRTYEALYIINPELDDNAIQTITADVEQLITTNGGSIVRSDVWGKRKLAYTIQKHTEGVYVVLRFQANPEFIKRLEQQLKLNESVIRYMVLYLDEKTLKLEEQQQQQYEEDLRLSAARRSRQDDDEDDDDDGDDDDIRTSRRKLLDDDDGGYRRRRRDDSDDGDDD